MLLCSRIREGRGPQHQWQNTTPQSRGSVRSASLDSGVRSRQSYMLLRTHT